LIENDSICREIIKERALVSTKIFSNIQSPKEFEEGTKRLIELGNRIEFRLKELLKNQGLDEGYLAPKYYCSQCQDTGFIGGEYCNCLCSLLMEGIPSGVDKDTCFTAFDELRIPEGAQRENTKKLKDSLILYAHEFKRGSQNILLRGLTGVGKSFLLGCTAREISLQGFSVLYLTAYDMLQRFKDKHFGREETIESIMSVDFLVIDDLGTEPMLNNITIEYLFAVLNHRSAKKLPYAVATNLTMAQLMERYGERIVSRLMDRARLVQLTGQDLRLAALRGNA